MKASLTALAMALTLAACGSEDAATVPQEEAPEASETPTAMPSTSPESTAEDGGPEDEARVASAPLQDTIPERFHGLWAQGAEHCGTPGHQRYDISAREIGFFESTGKVQDVRVDGNYAAATVTEQYGDAPPARYVFYMAIEGPDTMRIRYDYDDRIGIVRCPPDSEG